MLAQQAQAAMCPFMKALARDPTLLKSAGQSLASLADKCPHLQVTGITPLQVLGGMSPKAPTRPPPLPLASQTKPLEPAALAGEWEFQQR